MQMIFSKFSQCMGRVFIIASISMGAVACGDSEETRSSNEKVSESSGSVFFLTDDQVNKYEIEARGGDLKAIKRLVDHYGYAVPEGDQNAENLYAFWLKTYIDSGGSERIVDYLYYLINRKKSCDEISKYLDYYKIHDQEDYERIIKEYDYASLCVK